MPVQGVGTRLLVAGLMLIVMAVVGGCQPSSDDEEVSGRDAAATATHAIPTPQNGSVPELGDPVVVRDAQLDDHTGFRLEVYPLRRIGPEQVQLDVVLLTPPTEDTLEIDTQCMFAVSPCQPSVDSYAFSGVTLVDTVNNNRHLVLREQRDEGLGQCLCSRNIDYSFAGDAEIPLYAIFPAPLENVTGMTVEIPHFGSLPDVPIQ